MAPVVNKMDIPNTVLEAYDLLLQHRIVEILKPIRCNMDDEAGGWEIICTMIIPFPNKEGIPKNVPMRVLIREGFPLAPIDFYPTCDEVKGFPHQDAETGKLCVHEEREAPCNADRLITYFSWAREWLVDAAMGNLTKDDDPYELPDFSRKLINDPIEQSLTVKTVLFSENESSFAIWKDHIGSCGQVEISRARNNAGWYAYKFLNEHNREIYRANICSEILDSEKKVLGRWIFLPDIRYQRHRPPHSYRELSELCAHNDIDLISNLKASWCSESRGVGIGFLLIGFPIPKTFGGKASEVHWQPIFFRNYSSYKESEKFKSRNKSPGNIWKYLERFGKFSGGQITWGMSSNISPERMYIRGSFEEKLRQKRICLFGCGALGSILAELLARGGVNEINLFDYDYVEIGNLCRHTLDGTHLGQNKARALALRLQSANPLSRISGHSLKVPPDYRILKKNQEIQVALENADLLIDCTTNDSAFSWLQYTAVQKNKRLLLIFFDFYANFLTLCLSGIETSCEDIYNDHICIAREKNSPINAAEYLFEPSKEEQILEGSGCWHATFPALNMHIQMLVTASLDVLNNHFSENEDSGLALIIKRNPPSYLPDQMLPLVEIIWQKQYL